jgi:tRNA pseudouridine38-40 synthase
VSRRLALGIRYRGTRYHGWQSQSSGGTVQDAVEAALAKFVGAPLRTVCAGRTDAGVHALNQVVHVDAAVEREPFSWVRGTNRYLPGDVAVQWCRPVTADFHARNSATGRRYRYLLLESPVRPSLEQGLVGWTFRPLDGEAMRAAGALLLGEHDFSSFRSSECQAASPVKTLREVGIERHGATWSFDFHANAFLHHMIRNLMGCLVAIGSGRRAPGWIADVLAARDRDAAAPTFPPDGLYFAGAQYDPRHRIPGAPAEAGWTAASR